MLTLNIKTYQVIQKNEWSCPGMVLWVSCQGVILATQTNPENGLTYVGVDTDEPDEYFDPTDYAYVEEVQGDNIKTSRDIQQSYEAFKNKNNIE